MTKRLFAGLTAALLLAACGGSEPYWTTQDVEAVATWLRNVESPSQDAMWVCVSQWREGGMAAVDVADVRECEALAGRLARMIGRAEFGNIEAEDVSYPPLWETIGGMRMNGFDADKLDGLYSTGRSETEGEEESEREVQPTDGLYPVE